MNVDFEKNLDHDSSGIQIPNDGRQNRDDEVLKSLQQKRIFFDFSHDR